MKRFVIPVLIEITAADESAAKMAYNLVKGALTSASHKATRCTGARRVRMLDQPITEVKPMPDCPVGVKEGE